MSIQKASWGEIEWLQTGSTSPGSPSMSIGIVTILPGARQKSHIHYESEQFIYVTQGEGTDIINGKERKIKKDTFYYIPPNVTHRVINTGETEIKHIVVTIYATRRSDLSRDLPEISNYKDCLYAAVTAIRGQITGYNSPPVTIFDDAGNLVLRSENYPDYCQERCGISRDPGKCACFSREATVDDPEGAVTVCPFGLTVMQTPIHYNDYLLGYVYSGHLFTGGGDGTEDIDMYETSLGTQMAVRAWIENIADSIISFCSFAAMRQNLELKESLIEEGWNEQKDLQLRLMTTEDKITNLRIDHHFLFNTLNAIAGQALLGDGAATYQAITDLAKMLRYSSSEDLRTVPLREELSYLRTYLHMQRLRYGDTLSADVSCPEEAMDLIVPFNFLQPFVENAFTHGFKDLTGQKILKVEISLREAHMLFEITNNGEPVDPVTRNRLLAGMRGNSGHGLSLVWSRLKRVYGDDFSIDIVSDEGSGESSGTRISITLPLLADDERRGG